MVEGRIIIAERKVETPSRAKIAIATAIALIAAAIILVVAVLPAEYGIDPLGTGKALGLMDLAAATGETVPETAIPEATIAPTLGAVSASRWGEAPRVSGSFISQPSRYKIDSREITLEPGEGMEIKYNMKKGAGLIFSWTADQKLLYEFHGQPDVRPPNTDSEYYESYDVDDKDGAGKTQSNGTFIAPSTGIHGWFWENPSAQPVTLKLVSAGFYDWIMENRHDKQTALDPKDPQ